MIRIDVWGKGFRIMDFDKYYIPQFGDFSEYNDDRSFLTREQAVLFIKDFMYDLWI